MPQGTEHEELLYRQQRGATPKRRWGRWLGWALLAMTPFIIFGLFVFHFVVSAGAAGGCGGG